MLLMFIEFFTSGGDVSAFECLSVNLAIQEFFQAINFPFTWTKHQPTRNLHSSAQLFAVSSSASHFNTYLSTTCNNKIPQNLRVLARLMANCFVVFGHLHGKFVNCIIKLLFCMKFFAYCGFPNILIDMVSLNSWVESKFLHVWNVVFTRPDEAQALANLKLGH